MKECRNPGTVVHVLKDILYQQSKNEKVKFKNNSIAKIHKYDK